MATYMIGDVQGMYDELRQLLSIFKFDSSKDKLWFAGDLVNRGPDSLKVLRFVKSLGDSAITILGNHDFHLLAAANKVARRMRKDNDTLNQILKAPDCATLSIWLANRPLLYVENNYALVHAGLPPQWSVKDALYHAKQVEEQLRSHAHRGMLLSMMYGDGPDSWSDDLTHSEKSRYTINALTRMRMLKEDGKLNLAYSGPPDEAPDNLIHWADFPDRKSSDHTIICGHWAAQGFAMRDNMIALDSGCVWGGPLTAVRLEDKEVFQTGPHNS